MDPMLLELQIQIGVGKAAGAPMLRRDDVARLRLEPGTNLATPRAEFEGLAGPASPLNRRDVFPSLVVTRTVATMHCIEDAKLRPPSSVQNFPHVRNTLVCFGDGFYAIPYFAALGNEVVVGIND